MKATEQKLPLEEYLKIMDMTKEELKENVRILYAGGKLFRYILSDDLNTRTALVNGQKITQYITESGLIKALQRLDDESLLDILSKKEDETFIPELDEYCNLDFECTDGNYIFGDKKDGE